jgi:predicted RNA binding protein YcfA (HicA-like mRNA interferase family)
MKKITNISLSAYRLFLETMGCVHVRTKGGHELWRHVNVERVLTLQNHVDPVPAFIIKQHLRYLGLSTQEFLTIIDKL